jgi:hypothetical protein
VSVFIANPIHTVCDFTPPPYPKRKRGNPKTFAGSLFDKCWAIHNHTLV